MGNTASDQDIQNYLDAKAIVIDVRSSSEFSYGAFPNAINIPVSDIGSSSKVPQNKEQKIIVYCQAGGRSSSAHSTLVNKGYKNVLNGGGLSNMMRFAKK
ncbi:hypothetical protein ABK040_008963 [Willaertia magna]